MCLVNGQGHYFRSRVNGALYFHNRAIYASIWRHTKLYIAYNVGQDRKIASIVLMVFPIVSNTVSLAAVPITYQKIITECSHV